MLYVQSHCKRSVSQDVTHNRTLQDGDVIDLPHNYTVVLECYSVPARPPVSIEWITSNISDFHLKNQSDVDTGWIDHFNPSTNDSINAIRDSCEYNLQSSTDNWNSIFNHKTTYCRRPKR